jgi:transcriptional regulator with XRE-family HTH domain
MPEPSRQNITKEKLLAELELVKKVHHAETSVGNCVTELRRIHNLSIAELAKRAKITSKNLSSIESDDDEAPIRALKQVLSVFQFRLGTLPFEPLSQWMEERLSRSENDKAKRKMDPRWNRQTDLEFWRSRKITLDDLPFLFPDEGE